MKKNVLFVCIHNSARSQMAEAFHSGKTFAYVITVCDETSAERCPIFPDVTKRLHWGFPDPSAFQGAHEQRLARTREVRVHRRGLTPKHESRHPPPRH